MSGKALAAGDFLRHRRLAPCRSRALFNRNGGEPDFGWPALDKHNLGKLIGTIGLGDAENRSKNILGRIFEDFLTPFASSVGKNGGQFDNPRHMVCVLVERLAPYKGRIYDPCGGSGGMFVQSKKFVEEHGGRIEDVAVRGQESHSTTRRLAMMNLSIRIGEERRSLRFSIP